MAETPHKIAEKDRAPRRYPGLVKMDFHVHTPVSFCYEDNMSPELNLRTQPKDIVDAALAAGLQAMVVSDHNAATSVDALRAAAAPVGLVIFPGIEITAQGGHLLALFEPDTPLQHLDTLLDLLEFPQEARGDGSYSTHFWLDQCAERVVAVGGLAIGAHVDREPRGFIAGYFDREIKQRIHASEFLSGLEITDPRAKAQWEQGQMRYYPKPYPVVQGSDAHAPGEIGRRPTFLYLSEISLKGLRGAFQECQDRVKFPAELTGELG